MITVYATAEEGEGHVMAIGEYQDIEDIKLRIRMFANDVVITFVEESDPDEPKE